MSRYHANELLDKSKQKNDIQHWKYVKKIKVGSGNRYFYSWDEYKAYLADPTAELEKAGNMTKQEIKTADKKASVQVKKTGKKSYKEIQSRGRKAVEKMSSRSTKGNVTMGVVKAKNKSRPESFKQRLDELAKRVSENWNNKKESIKDKINEGKEWIKKLFGNKEEKEQKKEKKEKQKDPYEKYKYVKKITINGKTRYFYSQEELDVYNKRSDYAASEPGFMKNVKRSKDPYTKYEDAALVNPNYDPRDVNNNYEYNCAECTMIYELRRRGYDVESNGVSGEADKDANFIDKLKQNKDAIKYNSQFRYGICFENPKIQKVPTTKTDEETAKAIYKEIDKNPPGSRGDISVVWKEGGGHSMVWEKDKNGKITIIDTQVSGGGYYVTTDVEYLSHRVNNSGKPWGTHGVRVVRTDNLKLKKGITGIYKESSDNKKFEAGYKYEEYTSSDGSYNTNVRRMKQKERVTYYPVLLEEENRNGKKY